jgi:hypothetical protein
MISAHEYDPREDAGFLLEDGEPIPGRLRITFSDDQQSASFHINEGLFLRVVGKYIAARKKAAPVEETDGVRKARAPKSSVDDL